MKKECPESCKEKGYDPPDEPKPAASSKKKKKKKKAQASTDKDEV